MDAIFVRIQLPSMLHTGCRNSQSKIKPKNCCEN